MKAFTLIELLVVIVVIGILASISTATYQSYITDAALAKELSELRNDLTTVQALRVQYEGGQLSASALLSVEMTVVADAIQLARKKEDKTLLQITGDSCSDCGCRDHHFITDAADADVIACVDTWSSITSIIDSASNIDLSFLNTDPWGSPYLIDENEGEFPLDPCRKDNIFSAGPDMYHEATGTVADGDGVALPLDFYDEETCPNT